LDRGVGREVTPDAAALLDGEALIEALIEALRASGIA
jgi:hypothetical protein